MLKKIRNSFLIGFLVFIGFSCNVFADNVDVTRTGNMELSYQYDQKVLSDLTVSIYKVADIDAQGTYTYSGSFTGRTENINGLSASATRNLAKVLAKAVEDDNIPFTYQEKTDSLGILQLDNLPVGAYLVLTEELVEDDNRYVILPFFVSIPQIDSNGVYIYDSFVDVKIEWEEIIKPTPTPTPTPTPNHTIIPPSTYDSIIVYVSILAVSVIGVGIVVYYIYRKNRKKKGANQSEE